MTDQRQQEHYPGFGGKIGRVISTSESWWPPRPTPAPDAPNIVIVLADDLGYSDLGCYGSEIPTPAIDALADSGVRYTNFHVTPLCSPTRAALLTGLNAHAAGMGFTANTDPGFPGYASELPRNQSSLAEILSAHGYATMAVGKWHLCREADLSIAGDTHSWPLQRGFDQFYGFLEALTDFHFPHQLLRGQQSRSHRPISRGLLPHRRPHRPGLPHDPRGQNHRPRQAAVPVLRPRCGPRPAARQGHRHRPPPGQLRQGLGPAPRRAACPPKGAGGGSSTTPSCRPAIPSPTRMCGPGTATPSPTAG